MDNERRCREDLQDGRERRGRKRDERFRSGEVGDVECEKQQGGGDGFHGFDEWSGDALTLTSYPSAEQLCVEAEKSFRGWFGNGRKKEKKGKRDQRF